MTLDAVVSPDLADRGYRRLARLATRKNVKLDIKAMESNRPDQSQETSAALN
jgi:hypothetical protein